MAADNQRGSNASVFDYEGTLLRLGGSQRLLAELIQVYLADSPLLHERLSAAVDEGKPDQIRTAAHALRGLVANFGGGALIGTLQQIEECSTKGTVEDVKPLLTKANREAEQLRNALENYRAQ